jgi:hypothetical protein
MASEQTLIRELIRAKHINAVREKESNTDTLLRAEWVGQEIAYKQLLDILS